MRGIKVVSSVAVAVAMMATGSVLVSTPAFAEPACVVTGGVVAINGKNPCVLGEAVTTINYTGTIEDFHVVVSDYKNNAGFNFDTHATGVAINAVFSNDISTAGLSSVAADVPATVGSVVVTPGSGHLVYAALPYTLPAKHSINYNDVIVHVPDTTSVADALDLFTAIDDESAVVAAGAEYNITAEVVAGATPDVVVHLNGGQDLADIYDLIGNDDLAGVLVAVPAYHVDLTGTEDVIRFAPGTTQEEVLEAVSLLNVDATARVIGDSSFHVVLAKGQEPKVVLDEVAPDTGAVAKKFAVAAETMMPAVAAMAFVVILGVALKRTRR